MVIERLVGVTGATRTAVVEQAVREQAYRREGPATGDRFWATLSGSELKSIMRQSFAAYCKNTEDADLFNAFLDTLALRQKRREKA